ncbi:hypothetical protein BU23DRAFT_575803 [Bimuria novae-zelandiae CBS 107.79]|uniref:BHLH domain-containing protein n=1 Tax=Bimuria novae-zelandiae CBS 107.79 TaxID=1447943 RepID=A0A6A5UHE4_9PLEO|nr:hypothetical protein BU23DRAFT_575803 [Bimuria novae-zelandiae CBS 107.79]
MASTDFDWTVHRWSGDPCCRAPSEGYNSHGSLTEQHSPDLEDFNIRTTGPISNHTPKQGIVSTTDSWSYFPLYDLSLSPEGGLPTSFSLYEVSTSYDLQWQDHFEPTGTPVSNASAPKHFPDGAMSPANAPLPSPADSDRQMTFPTMGTNQGEWESGSTSSSSGDSPATIKRPSIQCPAPRKRGRPHKDATLSSHSTGVSGQCNGVRPSRTPHTAVERKYREGLNAALERLRRAVPTLPQGDQDDTIKALRPSKSMIIAGAMEYIEKLEKERTLLLRQYQALQEQLCRSGFES